MVKAKPNIEVSGHCINVRECSLMPLLVTLVPFLATAHILTLLKNLAVKQNICGGGFKSNNRK